jgi:predicted TIM-barrel fold metal-dependent hydrolase
MANLHKRRAFLSQLGVLIGGTSVGLPFMGCSPLDGDRYTEADVALLAEQIETERRQSGRGPYGIHRYKGYRGLAELPWFEIDQTGTLQCVDEDVPMAIDMHCHFGISVLFKPELALDASTDRVRHLLDCDETNPGCDLDLDIYINGNFSDVALGKLRRSTVEQGLWGSASARTHTIPNLLAEMDTMRVEKAVILPIAFNFPFGDDLTESWHQAIELTRTRSRFIAGASVHPNDQQAVERLEGFAKSGARVVKLHPTMQAFYPDEDRLMKIYEASERLGLIIFFHGGRAGIEPESRHAYAMPRHYEGAFANFPNLPFVVGHGGARDADAMLEIAIRHENVWLGIHGQGVTQLDRMIRRTGGERMLFGTDWPFYHLAATLAKVLIVTSKTGGESETIRHEILRGNAERLLA